MGEKSYAETVGKKKKNNPKEERNKDTRRASQGRKKKKKKDATRLLISWQRFATGMDTVLCS